MSVEIVKPLEKFQIHYMCERESSAVDKIILSITHANYEIT